MREFIKTILIEDYAEKYNEIFEKRKIACSLEDRTFMLQAISFIRKALKYQA